VHECKHTQDSVLLTWYPLGEVLRAHNVGRRSSRTGWKGWGMGEEHAAQQAFVTGSVAYLGLEVQLTAPMEWPRTYAFARRRRLRLSASTTGTRATTVSADAPTAMPMMAP
jgi:hypothetical protein